VNTTCILGKKGEEKITDTIEKLNFEKIAEIVKGLYFVLVKI
jgi:hypothetical protein